MLLPSSASLAVTSERVPRYFSNGRRVTQSSSHWSSLYWWAWVCEVFNSPEAVTCETQISAWLKGLLSHVTLSKNCARLAGKSLREAFCSFCGLDYCLPVYFPRLCWSMGSNLWRPWSARWKLGGVANPGPRSLACEGRCHFPWP